MHKLWGWLGHAGQASNAHLLTRMGERMGCAVGEHAAQAGSALAASTRASTAQAGVLLAAITGQVRFADTPAAGISAAQHLLALWQQHGLQTLKRIHGAFSLAIIDTQANSAWLAIDRIGIERLCFASTADGWVFGSTCDALIAHPAVAHAIDPQGIFNYLYAHVVPAPGTIYQGVEKLLPAQYALYEQGKVTRGFYWEAAWGDGDAAGFEQTAETFHALLDTCVRDTLGSGSVGAFLSGGTDSSTLSGMLTRVSGKPAETFSIGFDAKGFDEIEYARLAARHFGTHPHEYYLTPDDVVRAIPLIAAAYDEPFGNASAVPTYFCALKAKAAGIEVMLAGDGGDEIFGGNTRYAKQKTFELYGRVPTLLRKGVIEPLLAQLPLRKAKSYVQQANIPLPDRLETYNYLKRTPLDAIFTPEFLRSVNPAQPAEIQREVYARARTQSPINRMLHLDWKQTLADSDLLKVGRMCEAAGIEVRYPLLDERMVAFAAALPPAYKVRGQRLRWFFKEALRDFLPPEILTKSKHGFGLPFGVWMHSHPALFELAHDNLRAFRARGYLRDEHLDRLIQAHQSEHASYYGVMIWVIMMLEQWLQCHGQEKSD